MLLLPLDNVQQAAKHHPEGDVQYHLLQVFELAKDARPWDEEFLLAALLHDVGKGIDSADHVGAALSVLDGLITERTQFLIAHHMDALAYKSGTLGARMRRQLEASEHFEDLMLLRELDTAGRERGAIVGSVDQALDYLKELSRTNAGE
jgi:predicted HD phosphohydrolase